MSDTAERTMFTCMDRCDRCGAQAHMRALLTASELLFCAHHGREHHARLSNVAVIEVE